MIENYDVEKTYHLKFKASWDKDVKIKDILYFGPKLSYKHSTWSPWKRSKYVKFGQKFPEIYNIFPIFISQPYSNVKK